MILAIDSSTAWCSVGAYSAESQLCLAERVWQSGINHGGELLPAIDRVVREAGARRESIDLIAVARGPGTFNGVRVAMATAKGIALALGCPIIAVNTLEVHAAAFSNAGTLVRAMLPATRGQVATALWRADTTFARIENDALATLDDVLAATTEPTTIVGEVPHDWIEGLSRAGGLITLVPVALTRRRPETIARLARLRAARGDWDDLESLEPIYLRPPAVTIHR